MLVVHCENPHTGYDAIYFKGLLSERMVVKRKNGRDILMWEKKQGINQEQRDLLGSKKLQLSSKCLIEQVEKGNIENVKLLLDSKLNPNQSYMTEYPIYGAAKKNRFDILKLLYSHLFVF